ncbi:MAG: hypothetical protein ACR2P0_07780 [Acidimicrobiales bacterium]
MFLFSRAVQVTGSNVEAMRLAKELRRIINANSGLQVELWQSLFSQRANQIAFTTMTESRGAMLEDMAKFGELPEYQGMVTELRQHTSPAQDAMLFLMNTEGMRTEAPNFVYVTNAQVSGDMGAAMEHATELASFISELTGVHILVGANTVGPIGQMSWSAGFEDLDTLDATEMKIWGDPGYMQRLSEGREKNLFAAGSGDQFIAARVQD